VGTAFDSLKTSLYIPIIPNDQSKTRISDNHPKSTDPENPHLSQKMGVGKMSY
jgi:hypothetical protein